MTEESTHPAAGDLLEAEPLDPISDPATTHVNTTKTGAVWRKMFANNRKVPIAVLLVAVSILGNAVLGWYLHNATRSERETRAQLSTVQSQARDQERAKQVALDYAKGAADMDYKNLGEWAKRLVAGTSPELAKRLTDASDSMGQIIVPLQWVSTPTPIAAVVRSEHDGVYVVNCFVSVVTKNLQAPNGIQSTATYTVTVNSKDNWVITDVGGVDSALKAGK